MKSVNMKLVNAVNAGLVATAVALSSAVAFGADVGRIVETRADWIFVPNGFDDNDNVQVIVDGYLPSACYQAIDPIVKVNPETKEVTITPRARYFEGPCMLVMVPYTEIANVGILPKGNFKAMTAGLNSHSFAVKEASNAGPDDYTYAPVDDTRIEVAPERQSITATLTGRFTNSCMKFENVRVIDSGATLELLPVISMEDREDCRAVEIPYTRSVMIPWRNPGRYLLHTRSLNGKAVNQVFSVYGEG